MITPDECTSTACNPPKKHCRKCSHALFYGDVVVDGKKYRFSFNPVLGVDFINKDGESIAISRYITDNDAVWEQFSKWYTGKFNQEEGKK